MSQPVQNSLYIGGNGGFGQGGTVDHDHRQVQLPRGVKLGARAGAACVFGDDMGDAVVAHQVKITLQGEGAARDDGGDFRQGQRCFRRIDQTQQIVMFGAGGKHADMLFADGQKHGGRRGRQMRQSRAYIGAKRPIIAGTGLPCGAFKTQQRHPGLRSGSGGVCAHTRGKWMGGIDHMGDVFGAQKCGEPRHAAKAADACGHGLGYRCAGASGIGKNSLYCGGMQGFGEGAGLCGATKEKDALHG